MAGAIGALGVVTTLSLVWWAGDPDATAAPSSSLLAQVVSGLVLLAVVLLLGFLSVWVVRKLRSR